MLPVVNLFCQIARKDKSFNQQAYLTTRQTNKETNYGSKIEFR